MKKRLLAVILIAFLMQQICDGQTQSYKVSTASFSSKKYDEFSPAYYKNGIVFCTNRSPGMFLNYTNSQNKRQFNIYYASTDGISDPGKSRLFSKDLKSKLNDGPVSFNCTGDTIYYSRNLLVTNNAVNNSNQRNKLGIFNAVLVNGKWEKVREFRYNLDKYNITTPSLSPDAKRLYFASDKPGGFGGSDLYYCQWKTNYWGEPVNLGPVINTEGNESYPFITPSGDLFFSSDGLPGLGGKDIFFSQLSDTTWLKPVNLDSPVNSKFNDFGLIADTLINEGYFSSDRNKSIDIFHFKTINPQVFYTGIQKENRYSFTFKDNMPLIADTSVLQYRWTFSDGSTSNKAVVNHRFKGPGDYNVKLDLIDRRTGKLFFSKLSYEIELRDFVQPFINSSNYVVIGDKVDFDGLSSCFPGYKVINYEWNFGDGERATGGNVKHSFQKMGENIVNLCLTLKSDSSGRIHKTGISKKVIVLGNSNEIASILAREASLTVKLQDIQGFENARVKTQYYTESDLQQDAVFSVILLISKTRIDLNNSIFRNVPKKYTIKEKFNSDSGTYTYSVDQQITLMATYPAYREMMAFGYKDVCIQMYILKDQEEKDLHKIIATGGVYADLYFDKTEKLTSNAYVMLDQIVRFMNKYPSMKLEVAFHTDTSGSSESNLTLTQIRSQSLVNHLVERGINAKRLVAKGFGGSKPIASNFLEKDRKLNRRIDLIIIN
jgi:flagellar motor protein MotB